MQAPFKFDFSVSVVIFAIFLLVAIAPKSAAETLVSPVKAPGSGPLFEIHRGPKWGYMKRDGETAIVPQYDDEGDFFEGLAKVAIGEKWGYIDETGHQVIGFRFDGAGDFSQGLAPIQVDRLWGFVDTSGRLAIGPQFQAAAEFHDGLAIFEVWNSVRCAPSTYNPAIALDNYRSRTYTNKDAPFAAFRFEGWNAPIPRLCHAVDARYGFVDRLGEVRVASDSSYVGQFSEGLAAMRVGESPQSKWGFIDTNGRVAIQPQFEEVRPFSGGYAAASIRVPVKGTVGFRIQWGFIGRNGKYSIPPIYQQAYAFSEGLACVSLNDGSWKYIDLRGLPPSNDSMIRRVRFQMV